MLFKCILCRKSLIVGVWNRTDWYLFLSKEMCPCSHLMCQTLLNELKVTVDILLVRPWHKQLCAHWNAGTKNMTVITDTDVLFLSVSFSKNCFTLSAFYPHLYPWRGWTVQGCHLQKWAWLESLHRREAGCVSGSPLRLSLCPLPFLWPLQGKQLCPAKSELQREDCRLL